MSADERRSAVVAAAMHEFAVGGLHGTSTETIAARAGISQPYLFRLFPTKQALFLAAVGRCFERVSDAFERASDGLEGEAALEAMGRAYDQLIGDRDLLMLQLHSYAASYDSDIRTFVREAYTQLADYVSVRAKVGPEALKPFFAMGMLCNVVTALGLREVSELWAKVDRPFESRSTGSEPDGDPPRR
jgi:AcrR family transcriptional regulator